MTLLDRMRRPLRNLRISVTDRCNLRCGYCMPEATYTWLEKSKLLSFEEISRLVNVFVRLGVDRVRLTGGEPLLRVDLPKLVAMLAQQPGLRDIAMTTNGVLLPDHAEALRSAGLRRLTVSLDTLDRETFRMLAQRDDFERTLRGIDAARTAGFDDIKLDTVVIAGINDHELPALLDFARARGLEIRFIEYMDVGGATRWRPDLVVSRARILDALRAEAGEIRPLPRDSAPAERFELADGTRFGIISSMTQPFCASCDRARLTADGMWFLCLYALHGHDLGSILRSTDDDDRVAARIRSLWAERDDRGAEQRLAAKSRGPLADPDQLRAKPHLEMHTRGG